MKFKHARFLAAVLAVAGLGSFPARAVTFSIDLTSASIGAVGFEDDLFNEGPVISVPGVGGPGIEVNAVSYGHDTFDPVFYFSVDPFSTGVPFPPGGSAVTDEAAVGDHPADVFVSTGAGFNIQFKDGDGLIANPTTPGAPGAFPPLGLVDAADNLDALDLRSIGPMVYWSVDAATTAGFATYAGTSSADIFLAPSGPGYSTLGAAALLLPAPAIGLIGGGVDDIDALVYIEDGVPGPSPGDTILFSLTPGSATLGILGASPADVLVTSPGGAPGVFAPAGALGLLTTDNIDALDVVPEPSQTLLFGTALLGLALRRRRA